MPESTATEGLEPWLAVCGGKAPNIFAVIELTLAICKANFANRFNDVLEITPDLGI
jgi:hypothetical protein